MEEVSGSVEVSSRLNPLATPFSLKLNKEGGIPILQDQDTSTVLKNIRIDNLKNVIIGQLNINSLRNKFQSLVEIVHGNIDILILTETKLDNTFPDNQFFIPGYKKPYRLDRNKNGGGVMIYVREDIPSDILLKHNIHKNIEAIFLEINLRKNKILVVGTYHSTNALYGTNDDVYFEQMGLALDVYSKYDKFLLAGDFNLEEDQVILDEFMDEFHAKNLVKEPTCFKSTDNPSCIDLFITNSYRSFQKTTTVTTGLSDFHKMVLIVLKTTFPIEKPKVIAYRSFSTYNVLNFRQDLKENLCNKENTYYNFEKIFLNVLDSHAPQKKKTVRANHKPYVTKQMRKAIMLRSQLQNKVYYGAGIYTDALRKQKNYCNRLYKRERKKYYSNLHLSNITDNKKFWNTMKPLFSDKILDLTILDLKILALNILELKILDLKILDL